MQQSGKISQKYRNYGVIPIDEHPRLVQKLLAEVDRLEARIDELERRLVVELSKRPVPTDPELDMTPAETLLEQNRYLGHFPGASVLATDSGETT